MGIIDDVIFRFFGFLWRLVKTPLKFFIFKLGGYWLIIAGVIGSIIAGKNDANSFRTFLASLLLLFGWIMIFYHIIRLFMRRKNPEWGIITNFLKKSNSKNELKILDPEVPAALLHDEKTGLFFGEKNGKYVCQPENMDGHCLILGGPGSMKSTSIAIQTVRCWGAKKIGTWQPTMFVIDIKKELEHIGLTEEQRKRTKVFNPEKEFGTAGFDPFYLAKIRDKQSQVLQDLNDIAWAIIPESQAKDKYWDDSARDILMGVLLYGFRVKKIEFIDCIELIADTPLRDLLNEIVNCSDVDCRRSVNDFFQLPDNTLGSIGGTLGRYIKVFYQDEMIKNALRKGGMTPADLEEGYNIICQIPEAKLEQWKAVLTLMINQFMKFFEMRDEETRKLRDESILFLIDEAPRMGKLRIKDGLATLRSKGIHIVLFAQGLSQFRGIYGKDDTDTITANVSLLACLSATDTDSQRWLSAKAGKYDRLMKSTSKNQRDLDPFGGSGTSYSEQLRDIIPPEKFGNLPNTGQLILFNTLSSSTFCRVNKVPWFNDPTWEK